MEFVEGNDCLVQRKDLSGKRKLEPNVQHPVEAAEEFFNISAWKLILMKKCILSFVMPMKGLELTLRTVTVFPALQGKKIIRFHIILCITFYISYKSFDKLKIYFN